MSQVSEFSHHPVLFGECMESLHIRPDGTYVDCTAGGGGHSGGIYDLLGPTGRLISLDKDDAALLACSKVREQKQKETKWIIKKSDFKNFSDVLSELEIAGVDGILADLGVSSHQIDSADRGFSYSADGPLDMRMDMQQPLDAAGVVNGYTEEELYRIFRVFGEERYAGRIAAAIVAERKTEPIRTTAALSSIITNAMPGKARREEQHPARRCFQAIRIEVNQELSAVEKLLKDAPEKVNPGGRIVIISFHSLEDRIVKDAFKQLEDPCVCPRDFPVCVCGRRPMGKMLTRKPMEATPEESKVNRRAHSAKLRVFERNGEPWKPTR